MRIRGVRMKKYLPSCLLFMVFEVIAVVLWLIRDNLFYLLNFTYIGGCIALGTAFFAAGKKYARRFVQFAVGSYMLIYLGLISQENMQIEGFWYYLFLGVFEACPRFIMRWQKFSGRFCSAGAGADMRAGRRWFWICFPISGRQGRESG